MAEIKDIKALLRAVVEHDIAEIILETGGDRITIRRRPADQAPHPLPH